MILDDIELLIEQTNCLLESEAPIGRGQRFFSGLKNTAGGILNMSRAVGVPALAIGVPGYLAYRYGKEEGSRFNNPHTLGLLGTGALAGAAGWHLLNNKTYPSQQTYNPPTM